MARYYVRYEGGKSEVLGGSWFSVAMATRDREVVYARREDADEEAPPETEQAPHEVDPGPESPHHDEGA